MVPVNQGRCKAVVRVRIVVLHALGDSERFAQYSGPIPAYQLLLKYGHLLVLYRPKIRSRSLVHPEVTPYMIPHSYDLSESLLGFQGNAAVCKD